VKREGWSAIVLDTHHAHLASLGESVSAPVSPGALNDARHTLDRAAGLLRGSAHGVLALAGGRDLLASWAGQAGALADAGWSATRVEPWTTWRRRDAPEIHTAVLGAIDQTRTPLFQVGIPPADIARRLAWYQANMGQPWCMTGGVSGHIGMRGLFGKAETDRKRTPYWGIGDTRPDGDRRQGGGDIVWRRAPMRHEVEGYVHGFDLVAARLSAIGVAEFGFGRLRRTDRIAFDPSLAGYWLIPAQSARVHKRHTPIVDPSDIFDGTVWVTTPIMEYLARRGIEPGVLDSWTTPGRRLWRGLAERWDLARREAEKTARPGERYGILPAVRATYREAAGLWAHAGGSIQRWDWYHTACDRQRATVLGHIDRIAEAHQARPVAVHTDMLWYASTDPDPHDAARKLGIKIGRRLGEFTPKTSAKAVDYFKIGARV